MRCHKTRISLTGQGEATGSVQTGINDANDGPIWMIGLRSDTSSLSWGGGSRYDFEINVFNYSALPSVWVGRRKAGVYNEL